MMLDSLQLLRRKVWTMGDLKKIQAMKLTQKVVVILGRVISLLWNCNYKKEIKLLRLLTFWIKI